MVGAMATGEKEEDGRGKFIEAVKDGRAAEVKALLEDDPSLAAAKDERGVSAILLAKYYGRSEILRTLLGGHPRLDIFEAAAVGSAMRVRELVGLDGSLVNSYSVDGFTPLGLAAHFGNRGAVECLLAKGADASAVSRNPLRFTAVTGAVAGGHRTIATMLIAHGADVNYTYEDRLTPLGEATAIGKVDMVELLLSRGAQVNTRTHEGKTPLALAREKEHAAVVVELPRKHGGVE